MSRDVHLHLTGEAEARLRRLIGRTEGSISSVVREALRLYEQHLDRTEPRPIQEPSISRP